MFDQILIQLVERGHTGTHTNWLTGFCAELSGKQNTLVAKTMLNYANSLCRRRCFQSNWIKTGRCWSECPYCVWESEGIPDPCCCIRSGSGECELPVPPPPPCIELVSLIVFGTSRAIHSTVINCKLKENLPKHSLSSFVPQPASSA